jgi:hypothetical protein
MSVSAMIDHLVINPSVRLQAYFSRRDRITYDFSELFKETGSRLFLSRPFSPREERAGIFSPPVASLCRAGENNSDFCWTARFRERG